MKKNEIIKILENYAPLETAEEWDNSGWQIKSDIEDISKIMLCVSVTDDVIQQAIAQNIDLIIAHHPFIFPKINNITDTKYFDAIKNNIQIYSLHTNFDKASGGTSESLAAKLNFDSQNIERINDFVVVHKLKKESNLDDAILKTKIALNIDKIKVVNYTTSKPVKKIAFCAGAGGSFIPELNNQGIDLYITSDVKYHDALEVADYTVLDVGHLESEKPSLQKINSLLENKKLEITIANEKNIWKYL